MNGINFFLVLVAKVTVHYLQHYMLFYLSLFMQQTYVYPESLSKNTTVFFELQTLRNSSKSMRAVRGPTWW